MMKEDVIRYFEGLTAAQIANEHPGKWGDFELLDVLQYFEEVRDRERETAVLELILHSPEHSELVDYGQLYFRLAESYRLAGAYKKTIAWFYAVIAYEEQHEPSPHNRIFWRNSLAETHLYAGNLGTGLTLLTQTLQLHPGNLDTYNIAAYALSDVDLNELTVEVLDRAFAVAAIVGDEVYNDQWEDLLVEIEEEDEQEKRDLSEVDEDVLSAFRAALTVPDDLDEDAPQPFLPPIDQLATADSLTPALSDEILAQGQVLVPELIRLAFSDPDSPGPAQAITLLRQMRDEETAVFQELSPWLDKADGNWQQTLSLSMGKIGGFTAAELKAIADDTRSHTFVRTGATEALRERLAQNPDLRQEIVSFFRHLLNRPEAHDLPSEEEFIGFLISDALDADLRELYPDIQRAFAEDRVDPAIIAPGKVEEEWDLPYTEPQREKPAKDAMAVQLECRACGRRRFHFSRHVLVDTITLKKQEAGEPVEFDAHILDHEIVCPKCGAVDQYHLTPQARIALLGQQSPETLAAMFTGQEPEKVEPNPRVHYRGSHALGGPMHPLKAIQRYQRLIAAQPHKADLHMRLGTLLLTVMRHEQGLATLRQAYELAPENVEVVIRLAMAEHDFGDRAQAEALYERVFKLARKDIFSTEMVEISAVAKDGLKALRRGDHSPMDMPITAEMYYGEPEKEKSSRPWRKKRRSGKKPKKRRR